MYDSEPKSLTKNHFWVKFIMLSIVIPIVIIVVAIAALFLIAKELDETKKRKLSGIIFSLLCILFLISQISYLLYSAERYRNLGGLFGYYTSLWVFWLIGLYFLIVPGILGYLGYIYLVKPNERISIQLLFFIPRGVIIITLLSLFSEATVNNISIGGTLGTIISEFLLNYFGRVGTFLILFFGICIVVFISMKEKILPKPKEIVAAIVKERPKKEKKRKKVTDEKKEEEPPLTRVKPRKPLPHIDFETEYMNILHDPPKDHGVDREALNKQAELLNRRLAEFDVAGKIVGIQPGPVISRFEFEPAPGVKVNRIANLDNDLALALKATRVRVVAPIPGKSAVGIEVPNKERSLVCLKKGIRASNFQNHPSTLAIVLGEDITGNAVVDDISGMPHMLIAGTTGSGKSVCINTIILSLLYHCSYKDIRFLMIDPKRLELPMYNPIPHLIRPAVTRPKNAVNELEKIVAIMELRYRDFAREGVRDIDGYNEKMRKKGGEVKPYILIVVDELADLMLTAPSEIEENITRLAQMSRAVGIHLILATQRPSVDVITGLIKANFPCRIAFQVASKTDSRTILDMNGAETLLGRGDMLFLPPGKGVPVRLHGTYVSTEEITGISNLIAKQYLIELLKDVEGDLDELLNALMEEELWTVFINTKDPAFNEKRRVLANVLPVEKIDAIIEQGYYPKISEVREEKKLIVEEEKPEIDPMFPEAAKLVFRHQVASVSLLQRRLGIGYARAGRIIDQLEAAGVVEPFQGSKSRKVLIERQEELQKILHKYS